MDIDGDSSVSSFAPNGAVARKTKPNRNWHPRLIKTRVYEACFAALHETRLAPSGFGRARVVW